MMMGVASAKVLGVLGYLVPHETQHGPPALNRYDRLCGYREECAEQKGRVTRQILPYLVPQDASL